MKIKMVNSLTGYTEIADKKNFEIEFAEETILLSTDRKPYRVGKGSRLIVTET